MSAATLWTATHAALAGSCGSPACKRGTSVAAQTLLEAKPTHGNDMECNECYTRRAGTGAAESGLYEGLGRSCAELDTIWWKDFVLDLTASEPPATRQASKQAEGIQDGKSRHGLVVPETYRSDSIDALAESKCDLECIRTPSGRNAMEGHGGVTPIIGVRTARPSLDAMAADNRGHRREVTGTTLHHRVAQVHQGR